MSTVRWSPTTAQILNKAPGTVVIGSPGSGKACWDLEQLETPNGLRQINDIQVGDYLFGKNGKPTRVIGVFPQGKKQLYNVVTADGRSLICSGDHRFKVIYQNIACVKTVKEIIDLPYTVFIQNNDCLEYTKADLDLDPYLLGVFLGNEGELLNISSDTYDIPKKIIQHLYKQFQYRVKVSKLDNIWTFHFHVPKIKKCIPLKYLQSNKEQREALLQGLTDTIGPKYKTKHKQLAKDIVKLIRSLGNRYVKLYETDGFYIESFENYKELKIDKIEKLDLVDDCTCFTVDADDHQFIAGDTVVTHNTFFLLNVCANCLGMGQRIIAIDPKNDFSKLLNVSSSVELVDINRIRPGALNPFTFLDKFDTSTLLTIIEIICGKLDRDDIISITPIIKDFVTAYTRDNQYKDMQDVADYLFSRDNISAQKVGTMLKTYEDNKYGPLLFTRESNVIPLRLSPTSSMVISLHGMSLPDYTKKTEDYDANERFTSAIIYIITSKLLEILSTDNKIPTTLVCDEAHLLFGNKNMSQIIDRFLVLGRSLNVATVLSSQGISHFPPGISQYITSKFMFRSSLEEAQLFLEMFDTSKLDPTNAIDIASVITGTTKLETGSAFFIDSQARSGFIRIISNYDTKKLTSNPFEKERDEENDQKRV